jgi:hypothetical protein
MSADLIGTLTLRSTVLIERRSKALERENSERAEEEAWEESTRVLNEKHRQQIRREWCQHHMTQAERLRTTLEDLIADHEEKAQELSTAELPEGAA